jgi:ketosteroid isomerase-like protein
MMCATDTETAEREILSHMEELEAAENRKDIEGILRLLADDFVFVSRHGLTEGKESTGKMLRRAATDYVSSKHVPLRVQVSASGDMAWLLGYEVNERERDEGIVETTQFYVLILKKVEGIWQEVAVCLT